MASIKPPKDVKEFPLTVIKQMITLSTSGFGVVVALAWNEAIKTSVDQYVKPYFGEGSGIVSLFIYATVVTVLAVIVTMQLSKIQQSLEKEEQDEQAKGSKKNNK